METRLINAPTPAGRLGEGKGTDNERGHSQYTPPAAVFQSPNRDTLQSALDLAKLDFRVFPCWKGNKNPATRRGYLDATSDPIQIYAWDWTDKLIGIACGPSGFFAVDIDQKNGHDGLKTMLALIEKYGHNEPFVLGPAQLTPTGGQHWLFKLPEGLTIPNTAGMLGDGLDLRSAGYIATGAGYSWLPEHGPDRQITAAPEWLLELIRNLTRPKEPPKSKTVYLDRPSGEAGEHWLRFYLDRAAIGRRNQMGYCLALQLQSAGFSMGEAEAYLIRYALNVPQNGHDFYSTDEARASLKSAFKRPALQPAR